MIPTALEALNRSEIDIQVATAHRYPRKTSEFKARALALATLDEETAASMFYAVPRAGETIQGPSVRLAEIVGSCWGNLRYGARIVEEGQEFITAQGMCHDLETNNAASVEIRRRIVNRHGKRYNPDMIQVTGNAAISIALRQAIFKIVPFAFVKPIYEAAIQTAIGKAETLGGRRRIAFEWFGKLGVTEERVLLVLNRADREDVTLKDLAVLTGLRTAIKDGDTTVDQAFPPAVRLEKLGTDATLKRIQGEPEEPPRTPEESKAVVEAALGKNAAADKPTVDYDFNLSARTIAELVKEAAGLKDHKGRVSNVDRGIAEGILREATGSYAHVKDMPMDPGIYERAIAALQARMDAQNAPDAPSQDGLF